MAESSSIQCRRCKQEGRKTCASKPPASHMSLTCSRLPLRPKLLLCLLVRPTLGHNNIGSSRRAVDAADLQCFGPHPDLVLMSKSDTLGRLYYCHPVTIISATTADCLALDRYSCGVCHAQDTHCAQSVFAQSEGSWPSIAHQSTATLIII